MRLMKVELVVLESPVLDGPILNRALRGYDGRWTSGVVKSTFLPFDGDKKKRLRIVLRKEKVASVRDCGRSESLKSWLPVRFALVRHQGTVFQRVAGGSGLDRG